MRHTQRGASLIGLTFWGAIIVMVAILGMNVVPAYVEYFKVQRGIKATVAKLPAEASIAEARETFSRFAQVDHLAFDASQLQITRTPPDGRLLITFDYERRIDLFHNVALVLSFQGSSRN